MGFYGEESAERNQEVVDYVAKLPRAVEQAGDGICCRIVGGMKAISWAKIPGWTILDVFLGVLA